MSTPNTMPRTNNAAKSAVALAVSATKPTVRKNKTLVVGEIVQTTVTGSEHRFPLAQSISSVNEERIAYRWAL